MTMQRRQNDQVLRIECPYCRDRHGKRRFHTHGTGGQPGPWHRLAHCADSELLPRYRGQRFLSYEIIAPSAPRVIKEAVAGAEGRKTKTRAKHLCRARVCRINGFRRNRGCRDLL